jgi:hypothetical protein
MRHLFDVRNIIGALLGIYGIVLTIAGFAPGLLGDHHSAATDNPVDLYVGDRRQLVGGPGVDRGIDRVHRVGVATAG